MWYSKAVEYISLLGLLVRVNCHLKEVTGWGLCVYVHVYSHVCAVLQLPFSTWSLVINQDGVVHGMTSLPANWRTVPQRGTSLCRINVYVRLQRRMANLHIDTKKWAIQLRFCTYLRFYMCAKSMCVCLLNCFYIDAERTAISTGCEMLSGQFGYISVRRRASPTQHIIIAAQRTEVKNT